MLLEVCLERERFIAVFADVWSLARMEEDVLLEVAFARESFAANLAVVGFLDVRVDAAVLLEFGFGLEALHADGTDVGFLSAVD